MAKTPITHELKAFDAKSLDATAVAWRKELAKHRVEMMPSLHEGKLAWAASHMNYAAADGEALAYGIFADGDPHALAIVDIVYTKTGQKWLKMLDLTLSPSLDLAFNAESADFSQIYHVFTAAMVGAVRLTKTRHPAKVTKLYGRSGTLLAFLKGFGAYMKQKGHGHNLVFTVSIEGRWLVFRQK